jgi:hypothetical protein
MITVAFLNHSNATLSRVADIVPCQVILTAVGQTVAMLRLLDEMDSSFKCFI